MQQSLPVGFVLLTAASMKIDAFHVVAPYSVVEVYRRIRGTCCLQHREKEENVVYP
jgi:hypothetical protein